LQHILKKLQLVDIDEEDVRTSIQHQHNSEGMEGATRRDMSGEMERPTCAKSKKAKKVYTGYHIRLYDTGQQQQKSNEQWKNFIDEWGSVRGVPCGGMLTNYMLLEVTTREHTH
jgi:hypothetical protein